MDKSQKYIEDLNEIRSLMERSSRFISLSGLSGVFAGIWALAGAFTAHIVIGKSSYILNERMTGRYIQDNTFLYLMGIAISVLILAIATGIFFTQRKAKKNGLRIWDKLGLRLLTNLSIPLVTGGVFCLILLFYGIYGLVAPATLIFYGLALLNASKYTLHEIRFLGITEIALGLISAFFIGYGLYFWAIGFGVLHIIYGLVMYYKYDR